MAVGEPFNIGLTAAALTSAIPSITAAVPPAVRVPGQQPG
jgi:hypothetical protein